MKSYILSRVLNRYALKSIRNSKIDRKAKLNGKVGVINSTIGRYSYINGGCSLVNTTMGSFCSIAAGCKIGGASHPVDWVSSSPVFHSGRNIFNKHFSKHKYMPYCNTVIENDVWMGMNVLVKAGVTIGTGAIIGMGSVVTKDVPPYEIWAGNPARKIRDRFDEETKQKLLESKWWECDEERLSEIAENFNNVSNFLQEMEKNK